MSIKNVDLSGFFAESESEVVKDSKVTVEPHALAILLAIAADPRGYKPMPEKVYTPKLAAQIRKAVAHGKDRDGKLLFPGKKLSAPTQGKDAKGNPVRFLDAAGKPVHRLALVDAETA